MPNMIENSNLYAFNASIGARWSSCRIETGINAIIDRFSQIEPKIFLH